MSTRALVVFATHCRHMAGVCTARIDRIRSDRRAGGAAAVHRLEGERALWEQLAGEINTYLDDTTTTEQGPSLLDELEEGVAGR